MTATSIEFSVESRVDAWLYRNGEQPNDRVICERISQLSNDWQVSRELGLDVLASKCCDLLGELSQAMKERA